MVQFIISSEWNTRELEKEGAWIEVESAWGHCKHYDNIEYKDASKLFGEERVKEILETKSRFDKNFESDKDYISDKFHYVICHSRNGSVVAHSPTIKDMEPTRIENIL